MKSHLTASIFLLVTATGVTSANTDPNPKLVPIGSSCFRFDWTGQEGITWFIRGSDDLSLWFYYPFVEYGVEHDSLNLQCSKPQTFVQLQFTDTPPIAGNAEAMDFDGDGLPSLFEVAIFGTNPLDANSDSDQLDDGLDYENPSQVPTSSLEVFTPLFQ